MEFRVLGPVEVRADDGTPVPIGGPQSTLVLAVLLSRPAAAVSTDELAGAVWGPDRPAGATSGLYALLSRLRTALQPDTLARRPGQGYRLHLDGHRVDAAEFDADLAGGRAALERGDAAAAKQALTAAVERWRGPAYGELGAHEAVQAAATELDERRLEADELLTEARLRLGEHAELAGELDRATREHPFRERRWAQLMLALYRSGRQADALAAFRRCRELLITELGIEPGPQLQALDEAILLHKPELDLHPVGPATPPVSAAAPRGVPVPRTSFVGRAAELAAATGALLEHRLVTITGAGGVGKTRLAGELAARLADRFHHGVAYCDLVGVPSAAELEAAVVDAVGAHDARHATGGRLVEHLRNRRVLLVIDNADRVAAAVAALADQLLIACAGLHMVVTSRTPLGLAAEPLTRLEPLDVDTVAADLFLDRAAMAAPQARPAAADVVATCRRVGGLPLAIELAASRLRSIPMDALLAGLDERLGLIADVPVPRHGAGHTTLRDVLAWSIDELPAPQQALLRRLAVFAGGFTAAAATGVCDLDTDPTAALADLVDRSLVQLQHGSAGARYRLLETIRADGLDRLDRLGELAHQRERHLAWCRSLAPEMADPRHGEDPALLAGLTPEIDNVVAALAWSLGGADPVAGAHLATVVAPWWVNAGRFQEAVGWLHRAVQAAPDRSPAHVAAHSTLGWVFAQQGDLAGARGAFDDALRIGADDRPNAARELHLQLAAVEIEAGDVASGTARLEQFTEPEDDLRATALWCFARGRGAVRSGNQRAAAELIERATEAARAAGMWRTLAIALAAVAEAMRSRPERAEGAITEAIAVARRHELLSIMPRLLGVAATIAYGADDEPLAMSRFEESLSAARRIGDLRSEMASLNNLGTAATNAGDPATGVERYEQALVAAGRIGDERTTMLITANLAEAVLAAHHDTRRALRLATEVVAGAMRLGLRTVAITGIECAAFALVSRAEPGDAELAARLLGAAADERASLDRPLVGAEALPLKRALEQIDAAVGADVAAAAHDAGRSAGMTAIAAELVSLPAP